METRGGWKVNEDPAERNRRSVYIFVRRNTRYPMLESLDMPDTHESCGRRNMTTTAPQALTLLNSKLTLEWAQAFAARVLQHCWGCREPAGGSCLSTGLLAEARRHGTANCAGISGAAAGHHRCARRGPLWLFPRRRRNRCDRPAAAALVDLCHMLMNSNEFVYRN